MISRAVGYTNEQMVELYQRLYALMEPDHVDFHDSYPIDKIIFTYKQSEEAKSKQYLTSFRVTRYHPGNPGIGGIFISKAGSIRTKMVISQVSLIFKLPYHWLLDSRTLRIEVSSDGIQVYRDAELLRVPQ